MLCCMRTTVNLPDDLVREAKSRAAEEGITLTQLIAEGLRHRIGADFGSERFQVPVFAGDGMQPGVDLSDNAATRDRLDGM